MIAMLPNVSNDLWEPLTTATIPDIYQLQAKDFTKWLRKQARLYGRKFQVADNRTNAVEAWLRSLGFAFVSFQCGGEIEIGRGQYYTGWIDIIHYMTDEDGYHIRTVGEWLRACENERPEEYFLAR